MPADTSPHSEAEAMRADLRHRVQPRATGRDERKAQITATVRLCQARRPRVASREFRALR